MSQGRRVDQRQMLKKYRMLSCRYGVRWNWQTRRIQVRLPSRREGSALSAPTSTPPIGHAAGPRPRG